MLLCLIFTARQHGTAFAERKYRYLCFN